MHIVLYHSDKYKTPDFVYRIEYCFVYIQLFLDLFHLRQVGQLFHGQYLFVIKHINSVIAIFKKAKNEIKKD